MSVSGQWSGDWDGTGGDPPGAISGVASLSLSASGTLGNGAAVEGQNNGVQRPAAGLHVVARPTRPVADPIPGWIAGSAVLRLTARGELTGARPRKSARRQYLELLELELV